MCHWFSVYWFPVYCRYDTGSQCLVCCVTGSQYTALFWYWFPVYCSVLVLVPSILLCYWFPMPGLLRYWFPVPGLLWYWFPVYWSVVSLVPSILVCCVTGSQCLVCCVTGSRCLVCCVTGSQYTGLLCYWFPVPGLLRHWFPVGSVPWTRSSLRTPRRRLRTGTETWYRTGSWGGLLH